MFTRSAVRATRLGGRDLRRVERLLDQDPVANVYLRGELRPGLSGQWWGVSDGDALRAVALGGSLTVSCIPDTADAEALAISLEASLPPRILVGPRDATIALHAALQRPARDIRDRQALLAVDGDTPMPATEVPVRHATPADLDQLVLAAAAMHREELGIDPMIVDSSWWRARMATLVHRGWSWVWTERGEVVFKAELSALAPGVAQLQGVFTAPDHRRRGIAALSLAAICRELFAQVAICSLYVNQGNDAALSLYRRLGFQPRGEYATVIY
jgi:uncharacterized protein